MLRETIYSKKNVHQQCVTMKEKRFKNMEMSEEHFLMHKFGRDWFVVFQGINKA